MLTEFGVTNFRKFSQLHVTNLSKLNLFFGVNNVGKTSMLEAVFLYACGANVSPFLNYILPHRIKENNNFKISSPYQVAELVLNTFHDTTAEKGMQFSFSGRINDEAVDVNYTFQPDQIFADLIPNEMGIFEAGDLGQKQPELHIEIPMGPQGLTIPIRKISMGKWTVTTTKDAPMTFAMEYPDFFQSSFSKKPLISAKIDDILAHQNEVENKKIYAALSRLRLLDKIVGEMNQSFAGLGLDSIENIPYPDGSEATLSCRFQDKRILPLYMLGDGVRRWFNIIGNMAVYQRAIHCIEEIDVNFHHDSQRELSLQLYQYAKMFHNQIFTTSHSEEFLYSFLMAIRDKDEAERTTSLTDEVRVITLRNVNQTVKARTLNGAEALEAMDNGLELRV